MTPSLVTIPLAVLVTLLLGKVAWPRTTSAAGRTRIASALFVLGALSLASAGFEYYRSRRADAWILAPETKTSAAVRAAPEGKSLMLLGRVSGQNPVLSRDWVAFAECDRTCEEHYPSELIVELDDGVVTVDGDDYVPAAWRFDGRGEHRTPYLQQGAMVVVVADAKGDRDPTVEDPSIVFAGTRQEFREFAQSAKTYALIPLVLNLIVAIALFGGAIGALVRRNAHPKNAENAQKTDAAAPPA